MSEIGQATPHEIIILLSRSIGQRKLYFSGHPKVKECLDDCTQKLDLLFEQTHLESIFIGVDRGRLIYDGKYLTSSTIVGSKLISLAENLACGGFTIVSSVTRKELDELLTIAIDLDEPVSNLEQGSKLLKSRGIVGITLSAPYSHQDQFNSDDQDIWQGGQHQGLHNTSLIDQALFNAVNQIHDQVKQGHRVNIDDTRAASESLINLIKEDFCDLMQFVHYPDFDTYTVGHSVRMSLLGVIVAKTMEWDDANLIEISSAGLLHDVGKGRIPEEILFKPGRLDDEERRIIETHAHLGAEILMEVKGVSPMAIAAANGHHMHEDGGGYPRVARRNERSLAIAILQVCDVFEALTAVRPYKQPRTPREAYEVMLTMRGAFNPVALQSFVRAIGLYPPGSYVRLSDERRGHVVAAGISFDRPQVYLHGGIEGESCCSSELGIIELDSRDYDHIHVAELLGDAPPEPVSHLQTDIPVAP